MCARERDAWKETGEEGNEEREREVAGAGRDDKAGHKESPVVV